MLLRRFVLYLMLSATGALCAKDNPLRGQHLRIVVMEVSKKLDCLSLPALCMPNILV